MIILFLFLYFFNGHTINGAAIDFKTTKLIMCAYKGSNLGDNPQTPITVPEAIPSECEILLFTDCDAASTFSCNIDVLRKVVNLKPVILVVNRYYKDWLGILKADGNTIDAKDITDFAIANGAIGVLVEGLSPINTDLKSLDGKLAAYIIPYLNQLKYNPDFLVGVSLDANSYGDYLTDPGFFNYEAANKIVDFYVVDTFELNRKCNNVVFNGKSPIHPVGNLLNLDEVVAEIKKTKIAQDKLYLIIDLFAANPNNTDFSSYTEVCTTIDDTCGWCIPTTSDYYDKAKFINGLYNYGILVYWIELDDSQDSCDCGDFIGFQNIVAGFNGTLPKTCAKFDIKSSDPVEP